MNKFEPASQSATVQRFIRITRFGYLVGMVTHSMVGIMFHYLSVKEMVWFNFLFSVPVFFVGHILSQRGFIYTAYKLAFIELITHQIAAVHFVGWDSGFQYYLVTLTGMCFFNPTWGKRLRLLYSTLPTIAFVFLYFVVRDHHVYELSPLVYNVLFMNCSISTFLGLAMLINYYVKHVDKSERDLTTSNVLLVEKNNTIQQSIAYAQRIQNAVLPDQKLLNQRFNDAFILFKPKAVVSGDFYWFAEINSKTVVVCADCTGHGVPGGLLSMLGISYLNDIISSNSILSSAGILDELRLRIKESLKQTGEIGEQKDGMDLSLCIIDHDTLVLDFAGANNGIFLVRDNELKEIKPTRNPIGVSRKEIPFKGESVQLSTGDRIYLYTDGFQDQFGGDSNKKFQKSRLMKRLLENHHLPMDQQKQMLESSLLNWMQEKDQIDDITLIGLQV